MTVMPTEWLFIGPSLLAGIGQVTKRYSDMLNGEYVEMGQECKQPRYKKGFAFILPVPVQLEWVDAYASLCDDFMYMTICETETVDPSYSILTKYKTLWVASDFCKTVFERQFPEVEWKVLRLLAYEKPHVAPSNPTPYTFYTIGNVVDKRKNIDGLINAFLACGFGSEARLVLKATCKDHVTVNVPNVLVINGLLSDEQIDKIHASCHCYVNCSHSEGVGMGAVEAAMMNKPVIITSYGGLREYVDTPWVVPCTKGPIGFDDFLFTKDLIWGHPSQEALQSALADCFQKRITFWDHVRTREIMKEVADSHCWRLCNS
jgi:glycosyltransferase involved in cell wall biosynthesis